MPLLPRDIHKKDKMRPCICFTNPNCPYCEGRGFVGLPPREVDPDDAREDTDPSDAEIANHLDRQERAALIQHLIDEGRREQQQSIRSAVLAHSNAEFSERIAEQMDEACGRIVGIVSAATGGNAEDQRP